MQKKSVMRPKRISKYPQGIFRFHSKGVLLALLRNFPEPGRVSGFGVASFQMLSSMRKSLLVGAIAII